MILLNFTRKNISKGLRKTENELVAILKVKSGQKLCRNCIKKATDVTERSTEETEIYDDINEKCQKLLYREFHSLKELKREIE